MAEFGLQRWFQVTSQKKFVAKVRKKLYNRLVMKQEGEFMQDFTLNLSREELEKRTNKDYLNTKKMLTPDAPEYTELADGDKNALKH